MIPRSVIGIKIALHRTAARNVQGLCCFVIPPGHALFAAIKMDGGVAQGVVAVAEGNCLPLGLIAAVVDILQAGVAAERILFNRGNAVRNGRAGQAGAKIERGTANAGDTVFDNHRLDFFRILAPRSVIGIPIILHGSAAGNVQRLRCLVIPPFIFAAIKMDVGAAQGVISDANLNCLPLGRCAAVVDIGQLSAAVKRIIANTGDTGGNGHAGQTVAAGEGPTANQGDTVGDCHAGQAVTVCKR